MSLVSLLKFIYISSLSSFPGWRSILARGRHATRLHAKGEITGADKCYSNSVRVKAGVVLSVASQTPSFSSLSFLSFLLPSALMLYFSIIFCFAAFFTPPSSFPSPSFPYNMNLLNSLLIHLIKFLPDFWLISRTSHQQNNK